MYFIYAITVFNFAPMAIWGICEDATFSDNHPFLTLFIGLILIISTFLAAIYMILLVFGIDLCASIK